MILNIIHIIVILGLIALVVYFLVDRFPKLGRMWLALIIASIVVAIIGILHTWFCGFLCTP